MNRISLIGSTGSVGIQSLQVVAKHPDMFKIEALTAHSNAELLIKQANQFKPSFVGLVIANDPEKIKAQLPAGAELFVGKDCVEKAAMLDNTDTVLIATVGFSGLPPLMKSITCGKRIALANKESIVCGGNIVMSALKEYNQKIFPIDSEHSAIFQCMEAVNRSQDLSRIILTASGGPFRDMPIEKLDDITPEQAVKHPRWNMGKKISVDSATLMNKGFEVIEAKWLFDLPVESIDVVVHPQSIIHSMIELKDNSVLAQMGVPDMRAAIQYAITHPNRFSSGVERLDLFELARLDFEKPNQEKFPCLGLAYNALEIGGNMPTVLNAANEVAVQYFLEKQIKFTDIPRIIEYAMNNADVISCPTLDDIYETDAVVRDMMEKDNRKVIN